MNKRINKYDWRKDVTRNNMKLKCFFKLLYETIIQNFETKEERKRVFHGLVRLFLTHTKKHDVGDEVCIEFLEDSIKTDSIPTIINPKYRSHNIEDYFDLMRTAEFISLFDRGTRWELEAMNHLYSYEISKVKETKLIQFLLKHTEEMYL